MASNLTIPNTFSNGTTADAVAVNEDFAAVANWVNTNAVHLDGSKAFTATPSGPSTDPVSANQLTRKAYVDAQIAGINLTMGGDLTGTVSNAQIAALAVGTAELAAGAVATAKIADAAVTEAKLATSVAGSGLTGGAGTALAVNVDGSTLEINTDAVRIKDAGVTNAKLANATFANVKGIATHDLCGRAKATTSQTIPTSTFTNLTFAGEDYDYSSMHGTNDRVTVAVAGVYHFTTCVPWEGSVTGYRRVRINRYNSSNGFLGIIAEFTWDAGDSSSSVWVSHCAGSSVMATGDYAVVEVFHNFGADLDVVNGLGVEAHFEWHCVRVS